MRQLLVDTGFLVALYVRRDALHHCALAWLQQNRLPLQTVAPVIFETCFFLDAPGKAALLNWVAKGGVAVVEIPVSNYPELAAYIQKYADQQVDFADAALVWLANRIGEKAILTVDKHDFQTYRLKDGHSFELVQWYK